MPDVYSHSQLDKVAATIPNQYLRNVSTHGDAVVVAKQFCQEDATRTEIDELASAIEERARFFARVRGYLEHCGPKP